MRSRRGHGAIELVIATALLGLVLASVLEVLKTQRRFYASFVRRAEAWEAVAAAREILAAELRGLQPAAGDLYALAPDSLALRSVVGFAILCAVQEGGAAWRLRGVSGAFQSLPRDSVLVFVEGDAARSDDDRWEPAGVSAVRAGSAPCADGRRSDLELIAGQALVGLHPGAPVLAFRPYVYRLYPDRDGVWWLGRRLRGGTLQPVVGPMRPPEEGGLAVRAFDGSGGAAARNEEVALVALGLAAERREGRAAAAESAAAVVFLRNTRYGVGPP